MCRIVQLVPNTRTRAVDKTAEDIHHDVLQLLSRLVHDPYEMEDGFGRARVQHQTVVTLT
jgi:hypothetical protein